MPHWEINANKCPGLIFGHSDAMARGRGEKGEGPVLSVQTPPVQGSAGVFPQISLFTSLYVTGLGCAARSRLIRLLVDISDKASVPQTQSQFLVAMSIRRQSANSCDKTGFLRCLPSNRTPSPFCSDSLGVFQGERAFGTLARLTLPAGSSEDTVCVCLCVDAASCLLAAPLDATFPLAAMLNVSICGCFSETRTCPSELVPALGTSFRVVADGSRRDCDRCLVKQLPCFAGVVAGGSFSSVVFQRLNLKYLLTIFCL